MSFFYLIEKIKFYFQGYTAHGIHSPFVYKMVTECLRNPKIPKETIFYTESISRRNLVLLNRLLFYYQIKNITTIPKAGYDAFTSQNFEKSDEILSLLEDNQFWFILNIRKNPETFQKWNELIDKKEVTLSIDLFDIGIILKRKEQLKQDFKLKSK